MASPSAVDLLIEVPHGATRREHFAAVSDRLRGPLPDDLAQFFFVNTDVGAPEAAEALAAVLTADGDAGPSAEPPPVRSVRVLRGLVPRTFADVNRQLSQHSELSRAGWNPAIPSYVSDRADRRWLRSLHEAYSCAAAAAHGEVCEGGGFSVVLHSYAPRSIDVAVDEGIVGALRRAYEPEIYAGWPRRPAVEVITATPDEEYLADPELVARVRDHYSRRSQRLAENETYRLHPGTSGTQLATRWPGRTLCVELNRAELVPDFTPFVELSVPERLAERAIEPLAVALREHFAATA